MISHPAGCPNASLEAMASGLPVVATDFGGAREQVIDGITGRLVSSDSLIQFADAIVELANNPEKRRKMGMTGYKHVSEHFSLDHMISKYSELFGKMAT